MYSAEQRQELEKFFERNRYPTYQDRETLAAWLNLQEQQVQVRAPRAPGVTPRRRRPGAKCALGHPNSKGSPCGLRAGPRVHLSPVWCKLADRIQLRPKPLGSPQA